MPSTQGRESGTWMPIGSSEDFITWLCNKETIAIIFFPLMAMLVYLYVQHHLLNEERVEAQPKRASTLDGRGRRASPARSSGRNSPETAKTSPMKRSSTYTTPTRMEFTSPRYVIDTPAAEAIIEEAAIKARKAKSDRIANRAPTPKITKKKTDRSRSKSQRKKSASRSPTKKRSTKQPQ